MAAVLPDRRTFDQLAAASPTALVPLYRRLFSDALTPVLAYRRMVRPDRRMDPSFLFESVVGGDRVGRYSFLGTQPVAELVAYDRQVTHKDHCSGESRTYHADDPLKEMSRLTQGATLAAVPGLPAFTGGWVGYAGYDTVRYLEGEKLPKPPADDRGLPDLHMQLYHDVIAFDHVRKVLLIITHVRPDAHATLDAAYRAGEARLDALAARLIDPAPDDDPHRVELSPGHVDLDSPPPTLPVSSMGEGGYQRAVLACKEFIAAGDAFQIVPSQRFELRTQVDPFDVYRALRVVNPSPYMFYLQAEGAILIGSSPEILCRVQEGVVTSRPLAGTRRRGASEREDAELERDLLSDPKEVAEHVMLVDLHRNDVGRVAVPGTIALPEVLVIERYSHVMHISSEVRGRLRAGMDAWDALRVSLPVGTVSGAPKVRAMQIIDDLEPTRRGPYAGAVGYVDLAGNMDMAIALRTMVVMPEAGGVRDADGAGDGPARWRVHLQAGGGIVADSDPDAEHQETLNKAAALAKAVAVAEQAFGK
jgi:anthranilate synthase component 1